MPTYLDANGNPIPASAPAAPTYLDLDTGEPVGGKPPGFWENLGHTFGVGSAEDAQRQQQFEQHPLQSLGEAALGPAYAMGKGIVQQAGQSGSELGQAVQSLGQGNAPGAAVHAIQAVPLVGPALSKMADEAPPTTPGQSYPSKVLAATPGNIGTAVGTAAQVAPMLLSGADAAIEGRPSTIPPGGGSGDVAPSGPSAMRSFAAKLLPSLVDGSPEDLMTRAVKPGKNNTGWNNDVQTAVPLMKSAEQALGKPIAGVDDALEAAQAAKKQIWQQYQARLGPAAAQGLTIDGNQIADAMMQSIDNRTAVQNPGLVARVKAIADTYRKPMNLGDAEDFLQSANKDLNSYYAKNKVGQQVAQNDPEISSTVAEAGALRQQLYSKLDQVSGPGAAQLKQAYGSLTNVEKELYGRQLVAARQQPESLSQQLGTIGGVGRIAKGIVTMNPGDIMEGTQNIAVSKMLKDRNSSDSMIQRAFEAAKPAQPFPMPSWRPPQTNPANLLPAQSAVGNKYPMLAPDPGMSGGENVAALMQYLRQKPQLALPAKADPYQLPAPQ